MSVINSPFSLYTDAAGKPLDGAYIYIGQAGQYPDAAPATAYWDEARTIPAAQPLRTVSGYINRNGNPANVYLSGSYSIMVKDKNSVIVFVDFNRITNPDGFLTSLTSAQVVTALGYTPASTSFPAITGGTLITMASPTTFDGNNQNTLTVYNSSTNPFSGPMMQFLKTSYGIKLGLTGENSFALGGFSQGDGVHRLTSDVAGNLTALGNVTAYSDEKFKEEIELITNSVERTLQMQGIRYLDNQTGERKIGAIAQAALKAGFGEAVVTDANGKLSLAYGQLALALVIENTRELHDEIAALRAQLNELKG